MAGASGADDDPAVAPSHAISTSAPVGGGLAQQLLGRGADRLDVLARREPDRELGGRLDRQRRVADAGLAADDPVHVGGRLGARADVELLARLRVQRPGARVEISSAPGGSCDPGVELLRCRRGDSCAQRLRQAARPARASTASKQRMSTWIAFSATPPYIPECRSRSPVRTFDVERRQPARRELERRARRRRSMPPSKITPASAPRSSCADVVDDRVAADLLLAVAREAQVDRQRVRLDEPLRRLEDDPELALVVGDAARVRPLVA